MATYSIEGAGSTELEDKPFVPTPIPTEAEAGTQAEATTGYTEQAGLWGQQETAEAGALGVQKTGIGISYAQARQSAINSYQDALDQINFGMRQVGIQTRAGAAQRGLYEAGGGLSGIGQGVASMAIEPLVRETRITGERQAQTMANLTTNEQQAISQVDTAIAALPGKTAQQKLDLKNKIVKGIMDAAAKRQTEEYDIFEKERKFKFDVSKEEADLRQQDWQNQFNVSKEEADQAQRDWENKFDVSKEEFDRIEKEANIPGTRANQLKVRTGEEAKGRTYLDTMAKVSAAKKSGKNVIKVGKDFFQLSTKEEADLRNINSTIAKRLSKTVSSTERKDVIKKSYNQDLLGYVGIVQTNEGGPGQITREQLIQDLAKAYPEFNPVDIANDIYKFYPSKIESERKITPTQIIFGQ